MAALHARVQRSQLARKNHALNDDVRLPVPGGRHAAARNGADALSKGDGLRKTGLLRGVADAQRVALVVRGNEAVDVAVDTCSRQTAKSHQSKPNWYEGRMSQEHGSVCVCVCARNCKIWF